MKNLFPEYTGIPIPVPIKLQENFLINSSVTEIHGEFYSHIKAQTVTIFHDLVFSCEFSHNYVASETI